MSRQDAHPIVVAVVACAILGTVGCSESGFTFRDVAEEAGVLPDAAGIAGHAAAWGDVDRDGWPDLYVGTFGNRSGDAKPNLLLRNAHGRFTLDDQAPLRVSGRTSGSVFADLDNDGDLDLYVSNDAIRRPSCRRAYCRTPNHLFRADGGGRFTDVSTASGVRPIVRGPFAGRSVTVLDYDGDGLLDLLVGECILLGGRGRTKLLRNRGGLAFEDVTAAAGLPERATGLGVAAADVSGDGWPDVFVAGRDVLKDGIDAGNHLFVNDGRRAFRELPKSHGDFTWHHAAGALDDLPAGVAMADVNRDGLPDIVVGHNYDQPWRGGGVPVRLYLHRGIADGLPRFEDVTARAGLTPLPMKAPHVEVQDLNNDGWPDIATTIVKLSNGAPHPVIFENLGVDETTQLPRFRENALAVNDFPTPDDVAITDTTELFAKLRRERKIVYSAAGPSGDFDRDGRLDFFLASWWPDAPSMLLRNETRGGHWLDVAVDAMPDARVNRTGIGAVVRVYRAGGLGQPDALLGVREISSGYGYASGQEPIAHFGLGSARTCDVEIVLPHGRGRWERRNVPADQRIVVDGATP